MELTKIEERLRQCHDIATLNPMQQTMAATDATHIILLAPTGSGKTAAFALRLLRALGTSHGAVQAVVMAPSRELVLQIADVLRPVAAGLKTVALYGGHNMLDEVNSLKVIPDIIVATPGRLLDHLQRGHLDLEQLPCLVLDEYDKSLELGFEEDMRKILRHMRRLRLVILTSATPLAELPKFIPMSNPLVMDFTSAQGNGAQRSRLQTVRVDSPEPDKLATLEQLLRSLPDGRAMVFVNHRESAERVYKFLKDRGFPVGLYHGGLEQHQRQMAVELFNNGTTPILVATDLAARGLDIDDVNHIIHYHLPLTPEAWTHRNGRTARMGASGTAYAIIADGENIPESVTWDRQWTPPGTSDHPITSRWQTLYINAGKKEKISRGDIVGFLTQRGELPAQAIGKISLADHYALVAVDTPSLQALIDRLAPHRLKNQRVRLTLVQP